MNTFVKFLLSAVLGLSALGANAEPVVAEDVKTAVAVVTEKCKESCLILSPEDIAVLNAQINAAIQEAYQAGLKGWSKAS